MQRTWFFHTPNHAPRKNVLTDSVERDILILLEVIEGALRAQIDGLFFCINVGAHCAL